MSAGAITINLRLAHHALSISGAYLRPIGSSISIGLIFIPEDAVPRYEYKKARTSQVYERPKAKEGMIDSRDSLSQRRDQDVRQLPKTLSKPSQALRILRRKVWSGSILLVANSSLFKEVR